MNKMPKWLPYAMIAAALALLVLASLRGPQPAGPLEISYSDFKARVAAGEITEVVLRGEEAEAILAQAGSEGPDRALSQRVITRIPAFGDQALLPLLEAHGVEIVTQPSDDNGPMG